jgi:G patch domain/KOW motif-containing protein
MGWAPGAQIGLNNRGLTEPIEFVKRPGYRLGLGATPDDPPAKKKKTFIKPGESRDPPPVMVARAGPDGKVRHVKPISEKLVPLKKGLQLGQLVGIVSGPHEGLYARIVNTGDDEDVVVRLESSNDDLVVAKSDVSIVDLSLLAEGHPALKFMIKEKRERDRERDEREEKDSEAYNKKETNRESSSKHSSSSSSKKNSKSSSKNDSSWLRPCIMVRVVSKSFQNGKFYNKKVQIYDVVGHNVCTIQLDNGSLVEGVKQRMLETVIPQTGGKVMVVDGANKGKIGKLLERMKKGDNERAIVQMIGDLSIETFSLDDVAQYVGSYDEEAVHMTV